MISASGEGSDFVSLFVRRLLIQFNNPEEIVFCQGDEGTDIYFLAKGYATVNIADRAKCNYENFRVLTQGDHFGEISILYNCPRTATILSQGYCTFARLPLENYKRLVSEVPELETELKSYVLQMYNDDKPKLWAFETLKKLPFLQDIEPELEWPLLHKIYHAMSRKFYPKGDIIIYEHNSANHHMSHKEGADKEGQNMKLRIV